MTAPERLGVNQRVTSIAISNIYPEWKEIDGKTVKVCLNCGAAIPPGNRKYCSVDCSNEFFAKHNQAGLAKIVWERSGGKCEKCGWTNGGFKMPFPKYPVYPTPRPEENAFPGYSKADHRISHFENIVITVPEPKVCSTCGAQIEGEAYCHIPPHVDGSDDRCHIFCPYVDERDLGGRVFRSIRRNHPSVCPGMNVHCVSCGRKKIQEIEKDWNRVHRKALAAFKKAYAAWDLEYSAWVKTGVFQRFNEEKRLYDLEKAKFDANKGPHRKFVCDHKVPIAIGGLEFSLDNVWNLCEECNRKKTRKDQARIANFRKFGVGFADFWANGMGLALWLPLDTPVRLKPSMCRIEVSFAEFWGSFNQSDLSRFF